jgi:hypothetical protein
MGGLQFIVENQVSVRKEMLVKGGVCREQENTFSTVVSCYHSHIYTHMCESFFYYILAQY